MIWTLLLKRKRRIATEKVDHSQNSSRQINNLLIFNRRAHRALRKVQTSPESDKDGGAFGSGQLNESGNHH